MIEKKAPASSAEAFLILFLWEKQFVSKAETLCFDV